jgi:hypothetical protein
MIIGVLGVSSKPPKAELSKKQSTVSEHEKLQQRLWRQQLEDNGNGDSNKFVVAAAVVAKVTAKATAEAIAEAAVKASAKATAEATVESIKEVTATAMAMVTAAIHSG